ncbi:uncharacterized protein LOC111704911 [Eurytemora carolleeae]|uniref:uncharacterized protein LOC111704911 n=1 Tax=Eurytemora carolleeae TaxID=1294199 RepID=UPI000C76B2E8|nr:uncharacterized protein LOC111704911 [Eurytemora carolleeae]|eukprot:XP_023333069.1 uncharacterized protein LOC111704911 [Eurytemora affinis]
MRERDTIEITNLIFVLGTNSRKQEIIGFLDLNDRLKNVTSRYELTPDWLLPTRIDLTYLNLATRKSAFNRTKEIFPGPINSSGLPTFQIQGMQGTVTISAESIFSSDMRDKQLRREEFTYKQHPIYAKIIFYDVIPFRIKSA